MTKRKRVKRSWLLAWPLCLASGSFWAFSGPFAAVALPLSQLSIDGLEHIAPKAELTAKLPGQLRMLGPLRFLPNAADGYTLAIALEGAPDTRSAHAPLMFKLSLHRRAGGAASYFESREPIFDDNLSERGLLRHIAKALLIVRLEQKLSALPIKALLPWLNETQLPWLLRRNRLSGSGHNVQLFVLDELARRRAKEAVPALKAVLRDARAPEALDRQRALALRAVGALVAIGEQSAVVDLIDLAQRQGAETVAQLAHAISALGGRIAEGYLLTLASGHEHEGVRAEAALALDALLDAMPQNF